MLETEKAKFLLAQLSRLQVHCLNKIGSKSKNVFLSAIDAQNKLLIAGQFFD
jgi:hypothetical protein